MENNIEKNIKQVISNFRSKADTNVNKSKVKDEYKYAYKNNLAELFYNFLIKKSDNLPNFKYVDLIIKRNDALDFIISVGCGLFIIFDGIKLYARYEEPLSKEIIKIEEFYPKKYNLNIQTYNGFVSNKKVESSFEKERINVFLNYLKQYSNYIKLQENESFKSKTK